MKELTLVKRTIFTLGNLVPAVKPDGVEYRVDIGEDANEVDSLSMAVSGFLLCCGGMAYEIVLQGTVLIVKCLKQLERAKFALFTAEIEASGYKVVNFELPRTSGNMVIQGALGNVVIPGAAHLC